jgi:hypothetical protein
MAFRPLVDRRAFRPMNFTSDAKQPCVFHDFLVNERFPMLANAATVRDQLAFVEGLVGFACARPTLRPTRQAMYS